MEQDHEAIAARLRVLIPIWSTLERDPMQIWNLAPELGRARELEERILAHLALEECAIFPEIPRLSPRELDEVRREQGQRRQF
jgi:hypothetical protein